MSTEVDAREAAAGAEGKRAYVREMFSDIAPRYDVLNRVLSLRIDVGWRRKAIARLAVARRPAGLYVDLCAGTLDVSAQLARTAGFAGHVLALDFAEPMLRHGRGKAPASMVTPVVADALALPLPDASADGAIVAFGIRNLDSLDAGLSEVYRVLAPGSRFVILEFSTPRSPIVRGGYHAYFHHVLPAIGRGVSGHRTAYSYLPASVRNFPVEEELARRMTSAGFGAVTWESLTFGVAALHVGQKPGEAVA